MFDVLMVRHVWCLMWWLWWPSDRNLPRICSLEGKKVDTDQTPSSPHRTAGRGPSSLRWLQRTSMDILECEHSDTPKWKKTDVVTLLWQQRFSSDLCCDSIGINCTVFFVQQSNTTEYFRSPTQTVHKLLATTMLTNANNCCCYFSQRKC